MDQNKTAADQCPVCYSQDLIDCVEIKDVPIYCNVLLETQNQALAVKRGQIKLVFCSHCGHLFNAAFDPQKIDYNIDYENSLHYSQKFQDYAKLLANQLIEKYKLHGKSVIEIACGKGEFLALLCELGIGHGIGFDPSYEPGRLNGCSSNKLTFINDYYSDKYINYKADLVCCRHALEHIQWPRDFLKLVRKAVSINKSAVFFEVPNAMFTIKDMGVWDIIYEHCGYFSNSSLTKVFTSSGYEVSQVKSVFGDQFLYIEASSVKSSSNKQITDFFDVDNISVLVQAFSKKYDEKVSVWKTRLAEFNRRGDRTIIWGAGSKGVTFLNSLHAHEEVDYVVDINPQKWKKFVPGSGHKVVAPDFLKISKPDNIIVMNPMYAEEVRSMVKDMDIDASIISE